MMFDTDVLIWYFRGKEQAKKAIQMADSMNISAVTLMELIQGMRNKQELQLLNRFLREYMVKVHYINEEINLHAIHLLGSYALSDGVEWGDALIAATALYYGEEILTANSKHYRCFPNLQLKKFAP